MNTNRKLDSYEARLKAADLARYRPSISHIANGDEQRYAAGNYAMNFSKGLEHNSTTGLVQNPEDFEAFRTAIDEGYIDAFTSSVPVSHEKARAWEAPTAGTSYELEGPDPQSVTMPPAPALGTAELAYEMAEVYELALLRDTSLLDFSDGAANPSVQGSINRLNGINYPLDGSAGRARANVGGVLTEQTAFRGSSPGVEIGPYLSQFLWIGSDQPGGVGLDAGMIAYGNLQIDQRVMKAVETDYLTNESDWLSCQNGADLRLNSTLFENPQQRRFMLTPRDLATYVHDDALYEAYLNACLILLGMGAPLDPGFSKLAGGGRHFFNSLSGGLFTLERHRREAGGFALYGGPHILTLVTEVATRALKAVRYQKFNTHLRLRPEALAGRIHYAGPIEAAHPLLGSLYSDMESSIQPTVDAIRTANGGTALLPMAFQEGSPMHPSYGAGHATVAGACVTVLKAFFDTSSCLMENGGAVSFAHPNSGGSFVQFTPNNTGSSLSMSAAPQALSLEGELNKLAANISIGRNMAGVHYYSDYYDSLRMGEEIALGILEEQALCYPTDPFVFSVPTFDGQVRRIGNR